MIKRFISIIIAVLLLLPVGVRFSTQKAEAAVSTGDFIQFGTYPQSRVSDQSLINTLANCNKTWESFGYYSGTLPAHYSGSVAVSNVTKKDYWQYADFFYSGIKYRAIKFTHYRPSETIYDTDPYNSYQDDRGYSTNTVYYFKYEPIKWRILDVDTGLCLAKNSLDSQPFNYFSYYSSYYDNDGTADYAESSIRKWLSYDFYNTAFTVAQKNNIRNDYSINNSLYDRVFLLSGSEADSYVYGAPGIAYGTDYAKSQGLYLSSYNNASCWWTRSPRSSMSKDSVYFVDSNGYCANSWSAYTACVGICPSLRLKTLKSDTAFAKPSDVLDTSYIDLKNTEYDLKYPVYNENDFAKELEVWIKQSDYFDAFKAYLDEGYTYKELLHFTVDTPAFLQDQDVGVSVKSEIEVKDVMAYIIFDDLVQQFIDGKIANIRTKAKNNQAIPYTDFYDAVKEFNIQYDRFQKELNGKDTMHQTFYSILLANLGMHIINEAKITYSTDQKDTYLSYYDTDDYGIKKLSIDEQNVTGEFNFKSVSYAQKLYKMSVEDTPANYDSFEYYLLSGGDKSYLNKDLKKNLDNAETLHKLINDGLATIKKVYNEDYTDLSDSVDFMDHVQLAANGLLYLSDRYGSKLIKDNKAYDTFNKLRKPYKTCRGIISAVAKGSYFGLIGGAWDLQQQYINEVKKVYEDCTSSEAGWYALTYYYIGLNHPNDIDSIINPTTGAAGWAGYSSNAGGGNLIDQMTYNYIPFDFSDPIEKKLGAHYQNNYVKSAGRTYSPREDLRLYLLNATSKMISIKNTDCVQYKDMMLKYLLAEINLKNGVHEIPAKVYSSSNNIDLGTVTNTSTAKVGETVTLTAQPKENSTFVGWVDTNTGDTVSNNTEYHVFVDDSKNVEAVFVEGNIETAALPIITSISGDAVYYKGISAEPLTVNAEASNGQLSVAWYQNEDASNVGGTYLGTYDTYTPNTGEVSEYYYYAIVTNTFTDSSGVTTTASTRSNVIKVNVLNPSITNIAITVNDRCKEVLKNQSFNKYYLTVKLIYSDGTESTLNSDDYNMVLDTSTIGLQTGKIHYFADEGQFEVRVVDSITQSFREDENVTWTLDSNGTMTINGTGNIPPYVRWELEDYSDIIKEVIIEGDIQRIGFDAFSRLPNLQKVDLGNTVEEIEPMAFAENEKLTAIVLPESVTTVGSNALSYTGITELTIPASVTTLDGYALSDCPNLEKVTILGEISELPYGMFSNCQKLESISIPKTVTAVQADAFNNCSSLKNIYYGGTEEEWNAITISENGNDLINVTIHYNSSMPNERIDILGDADGDGQITILDATTIQRYLADYTVSNPENVLKCGNIAGDGIDILDATLIQRYLADFTVQYDIGKPRV